MTRSALRSGGLCCALLATTALTAPAMAQSTDIAPPSRYQIDENGVDVARGTMALERTDLAIGPAGRAGLALNIRYGYNNGSSNFENLSIYGSGTSWNAGVGLRSIPFTKSGSTYTVADGSGATLVQSGSIWTLTMGDGTVIVYNYTTHDSGDFNKVARATSITYPSGEVHTLTWVDATWCSTTADGCAGGTWLTAVRLQAISTSMGYQFHYNYGRGSITIPSQAAAWRRLDGITAINTTVDSCTPSAHSCTLTQTWPTVGYSGNDVTDPAGRTSTYTQGSLTYSIRRPSASTANATYSIAFAYTRYTVTQVVRDGLTWNYNYSVSGNTATMVVTEPGTSRTRTIVSDLNVGLPTSVTDELGRTTAYTYDGSGRLTRTTLPEGNYVAYTYDSRGNRTEQRRVSKAALPMADIVATATYPSSCSNVVTCNQPTATTDARGNTTDYTYDSTHGGVLTVTAPAPSSGAVRPQTRIAYSSLTQPGGGTVYRPTTVSQCQTTSSCSGTADEAKTTIAYSQANLQPTGVTRAAGDGSLTATTTVGYDYVARPISVDGPLSGTTDTSITRYNLAGQVVGIVSPDPDDGGSLHNRARRITYNSDGQASKVEQGTVNSQSDGDWAGFSPIETVDIGYDSTARPVRGTLTAGGALRAVIEASYDAVGRPECTAVRMSSAAWGTPTSACTPQTAGSLGPDRVTRTSYDAANQVTLVQSGYGVSGLSPEEVSYTYWDNGQIKTLADAAGNINYLHYDGHDRQDYWVLPHRTSTGSWDWTNYEYYVHDANGNLAGFVSRDSVTTNFGYDALNRLSVKDLPGTSDDVVYTYDLRGLPLYTVFLGSGEGFLNGYDALGRLTSASSSMGGTTRNLYYQYDAAGRRTQMTYADSGLYVNYDYLWTGEVKRIRENGATTGIGVLGEYSYDDLGRRTNLARGNGTSTSYGYSFDSALRTLAISHDLLSSGSDVTFNMTYNPAGQIATREGAHGGYAWQNHYALNRNYSVNGLNQYTASGSITPTYDGRGNVTSAGAVTYGYNAANMLTSASDGATLSYDPLLRLYETVGGGVTTRMAYDGDQLIAEYNGSNALQRRYVYGPGTDEPLVWYQGTGTSDRRWYHADERGSIITLSDASGNNIGYNSYDEYGFPGAWNTGRFQYTGQQWIAELGMYHYRARIYSPGMGRFMQPDPIGYGGGVNLYAYVHNDPVNFFDPSGLRECYNNEFLEVRNPHTPAGDDPDNPLGGTVTANTRCVLLIGTNPVDPGGGGVPAGNGPGGGVRPGCLDPRRCPSTPADQPIPPEPMTLRQKLCMLSQNASYRGAQAQLAAIALFALSLRPPGPHTVPMAEVSAGLMAGGSASSGLGYLGEQAFCD